MSDPILSIIIVSFNTKDLLRDCINSIYSNTKRLSSEVIVVDNNSKDGSIEMLQNEFKEITLIKNNENLGFAKANNQAINIAKGTNLLLLNSDTILKENTTEKLAAFMAEHPKAAAVGPKVLNSDFTLQSKGFLFPSITHELIGLLRIPKFFNKSLLYHYFPNHFWDEDCDRPVDWISGCCMLLSKEVVNKIGTLCEDFFMYYEDEEWCYRAHRAGYQVWYCPVVSVIHDNNSSPMEDRLSIVKKNTKTFLKKTIGIWKGLFIQVISLSSNIFALIGALIMFKSAKIKIYLQRIHLQISFMRCLIATPDE